MVRPLIDKVYYQPLADLCRVDKDDLVACAGQTAAVPEFGAAIHGTEKPAIAQHLSGAALAASEDQALDGMVTSCLRFQAQLPVRSLGTLLMRHKPLFGSVINALSEAKTRDRSEQELVLSRVTVAVYMLFFKAQKIDSYGVHHKGQTHAASVDAMAQILLDALVTEELSEELYGRLEDSFGNKGGLV
jgi:hypothetical protein